MVTGRKNGALAPPGPVSPWCKSWELSGLLTSTHSVSISIAQEVVFLPSEKKDKEKKEKKKGKKTSAKDPESIQKKKKKKVRASSWELLGQKFKCFPFQHPTPGRATFQAQVLMNLVRKSRGGVITG